MFTRGKTKRCATRRLADRHLQAQVEKYPRLIQAGQSITSELNVDALFDVISDQTGKLLNVERCSILLVDENERNLFSFAASAMESDQIRFSTDQGIAGWVFCNKTPQVVNRIKSILDSEPERIETIRVDLFMKDIHDQAADVIRNRHLKVTLAVEDELYIKMDKTILKKIGDGLLKNAIENTPDEGTIALRAGATTDDIFMDFRDYGIGISSENKKHIFKGFFHTQPTRHYSSKTPYAFNAGGTGTDLLRMRTYAERLGFKIDFSSQCCRFIPGDAVACPGSVSLCTNITSEMDCMASGGSLFTVRFPKWGD